MKSIALGALALLTGCTHAGSQPARAPAAPTAVPAAREIHWYLTAAERDALYEQAYRVARDRLPLLAQGRAPGTWAVVLDADETVLDNGPFQLQRWRAGRSFSAADWRNWVHERSAQALPGASDFIREVRQHGGAAIIVTNRTQAECSATRDNLAQLGIVVAGVLCRSGEVRDKNPRFRSIADGTTELGLPPLAVVAFVGDNIQDFPNRSQVTPGALAEFGRSQFILPNPMYGSWEQNSLDLQ